MIRSIFIFFILTSVQAFASLDELTAKNDTRFSTLYLNGDKITIPSFDLNSEPPSWMREAIVYQVTPYSFVKNGTFEDIEAKLDELKELGINTLMIQPVFKTYKGYQGYDIIDYLSLNKNFGGVDDFHNLISKAKSLGMRVILDIVINHSSIHHPYAKDCIVNGAESEYYDFYQHKKDGKPYSSFYHLDDHGFIYYFWKDLINLNYQNEKVQEWILEICKYWVREFDIDGYRFDAIWGVNARAPLFAKRLRKEMKSINPEILLLAEDKGSDPEVYKLGFDAAYDWTPNKEWVSQWAWEYKYEAGKSHTIFDFPKKDKRGKMLEKAIFQNGGNNDRKLRFMENNDLPRFIHNHSLAQTRMVAALMFSLPGIPMLYNGQEIGAMGHPYRTQEIFKRESSIKELDTTGLFTYYKRLIALRKQYAPALEKGQNSFPFIAQGASMAFIRKGDEYDFLIVLNMDDIPTTIPLDLNKLYPNLSPNNHTLIIKDILGEELLKIGKDTSNFRVQMEGNSARWLKIPKNNP